jgi:hypothetical protein
VHSLFDKPDAYWGLAMTPRTGRGRIFLLPFIENKIQALIGVVFKFTVGRNKGDFVGDGL